MISIDQIEAAVAQLEIIRMAIVGMNPDKRHAKVLDRVYKALEVAEKELAELCDDDTSE